MNDGRSGRSWIKGESRRWPRIANWVPRTVDGRGGNALPAGGALRTGEQSNWTVANPRRFSGNVNSCAPGPVLSLLNAGSFSAGFYNWPAGLRSETSLKDFRKDIVIQLRNEAGQVVLAYQVYRCRVSEYQALPELHANGNAGAIESMTLQNEGWERDYEVKGPAEPRFTKPT